MGTAKEQLTGNRCGQIPYPTLKAGGNARPVEGAAKTLQKRDMHGHSSPRAKHR